MILTCPDCATRYFVADDKLGGEGKAVRCAACGARWTARAKAEVEIELSLSPELGAVAEDVTERVEPAPEVPEFPKALPQKFRAQAAEKSAMRRAIAHGAVWAVLIAILVGAFAASIVFRVEVVRLVPRAASAYAMAGLKVNAIGLTFENVSARPALQDGHAALVVSGEIRNIESQAATAPALRINVFNRTGARVATMVSRIEDARVAPGESHHFVIPMLDPPPTAEKVEISFELGVKVPALRPSAHRQAVPKAPAPVLRASEPEPVGEPEPAVLLPASYAGAEPHPAAPAAPAASHGAHP